MATKYKFPEYIELPWYVIPVVELPPDHPELEGTYANWDVDAQIIYVDETRPLAEKRWLLLHEADHAWNDWKLWVQQNMPVRVPDKYQNGEVEEEEGP